MLSAYLQSRVARRLFVLFLLAALVPVALLGLVTYNQVKHHLIDLSQQQLRQESKTFGMSLIGRLQVLREALRRHAAEAVDSGRVDPAGHDGFSGFVRVDEQDLRLTDAQQRQLMLGEVVLLAENPGHYSMLLRLTGPHSLLQGHVQPATLWSDASIVTPYCVLDATGEVQYCSPEISGFQIRLPAARSSNSGVFIWQSPQETYLAAYWHALLQAPFANQGLTVVTLHARTEILAELTHFRMMFPAVLALALAAAAWLSLGQIRRQMQPLHTLTVGAHRLAQGDFDVAVDIQSQDEFGDLARAFKRMSLRLKQKFHLLEALGELDRAILSASEMEYVVQTVLEHAPLTVNCDFIIVLQTKNDPVQGEGWLSYRIIDGPPQTLKANVTLDATTLTHLTSDQPWLELESNNPAAGFLHPLFESGLAAAWLFPAAVDSHLSTVFILGYRERAAETQEMLQVGRSIADRLTVAGSNIAWEEKLYHNAHYDALTDLPNRVLLRDRVEQAINRAKRDGRAVAVMLLDLDRFKEVNDTMGHSSGDELLARVADKLSGLLRESDTIARLGGDEFVILLTDLERGNEATAASSMAEKLLKTLTKPVTLDEQTVNIGASIGIALYPDNSQTYEDLLKGADAAMYESKRIQRGGYRFYSTDINRRAKERFHLVQELRLALERNEFLLYYQPKVEVGSGRIVSAEALIRWQSPTRGLLPPGLFIGMIDEIGLSHQLGEWVLRTACAQLAAWDRLGLPAITLSVNVLPSELLQSDYVDRVLEIITSSGLKPERIELEILEETAVDSSEETKAKLFQLSTQGVKIALDDFGTGYSSLIYLTRIPANILKLDRGFICELATSPRQLSIVAGIITLARHLDMKTVAEGVETGAQRDILEVLECDLIQGYLYSPPLPAKDFSQLLQQRRVALA